MSETKFTKGEWVVDYDNNSSCEWYYTGPAKVEYSYRASAIEYSEALANAHLIAAAPEMYELLDSLYVHLDFIGDERYKNNIKNLLAKARGEK
ncbi:hypothetical protein NVP1284A_55 [Vibrio phage 1.284.A._10N.286.55.A5]|nr:hypothetical protein NVP1284A_55 [Vibrio phage 1.284.A._10N.286.55.A5]AUS01628.1 hypothetical protein NVP1287O_55 [Vibrio phage 1.287.O._10N.286.55.C7]AUS01698.1 hypothetical protein NVP1289A_54 [Vibrio phage 1.289.A._10N.286.55.E8]